MRFVWWLGGWVAIDANCRMGHFDRLAKAKLAGTLARVRAPHSNVAELCRFCDAGTGATTCSVTGSRVPARGSSAPNSFRNPPTNCRSIWSIVCSVYALAQVYRGIASLQVYLIEAQERRDKLLSLL
jgi:hypothetical protein